MISHGLNIVLPVKLFPIIPRLFLRSHVPNIISYSWQQEHTPTPKTWVSSIRSAPMVDIHVLHDGLDHYNGGDTPHDEHNTAISNRVCVTCSTPTKKKSSNSLIIAETPKGSSLHHS